MTRIVTTVQSWDDRLILDVVHHRSDVLNAVMSFATKLGDGWAWIFLGLCIAVFDPFNIKYSLLPLSVGLLIELPVHLILKKSFSRPRPYQICAEIGCLVKPRDRFSFPSGHTSTAFVVLVVLSAAYSWLLLPLLLLAITIGASRIYLGVHYPSDVLAGALLGFLSGTLALWTL